MRRSRSFVNVLAVAMLGAQGLAAQDGAATVEEELRTLARATTRLVETLERQERMQAADRRLLRVQVAVEVDLEGGLRALGEDKASCHGLSERARGATGP